MTTRTITGGSGLGTMLKAALPAVPVVNQLPGVKKTGRELPDLILMTSGVVDRDKVAAYNTVCGFATKETAPLTYLHMLAFPLHMALMTDTTFPFVALGMVHVENSITQHRPVRYGEKVDLALRGENLRHERHRLRRRRRGVGEHLDLPADGQGRSRERRPGHDLQRGPGRWHPVEAARGPRPPLRRRVG